MTRARARWFVESIITAGNTIWHLAIKPPLWNTCCRRNCSVVAAKPVHAFCPCRRTSASRSDFFPLGALSRFLHIFFPCSSDISIHAAFNKTHAAVCALSRLFFYQLCVRVLSCGDGSVSQVGARDMLSSPLSLLPIAGESVFFLHALLLCN